MLIVSSREFRQNQKHYLDLIDSNENIVIQRGKDKAYKISLVNKNDTILTEQEFIAKIDLSILQAVDGKITQLTKEAQKELLG